MNHISFTISLVALLPALVLCAYIYRKDRVEKEPLHLLALLFIAGAAAYLPTIWLKGLIGTGIDALFVHAVTYSVHGLPVYGTAGAMLGHKGLTALLGVALVEESLKWGLLTLLTRRSRHFNCLFDGVVYAAFVSLGFAAAENLQYAWLNGCDTLLLRTVVSVPGHLFFGILMGFGFSLWHIYSVAAASEEALLRIGRIQDRKIKSAGLWMAFSLAVPILLHSIYTFAGSIPPRWVTVSFYVLVVALCPLCIVLVNRLSRHDGETNTISHYILMRKHPQSGGGGDA